MLDPALPLIDYATSHQALFAPGTAGDYFQHGPFPSEAALCAELSRVAYVQDPGELTRLLGLGGLRLIERIDARGTQGFVAEKAGRFFVAFRGTEPDPTDIFTDVRVATRTWHGLGRVHTGFADALSDSGTAWSDKLPSNGDEVLFTGHSLGAALATLAAARRTLVLRQGPSRLLTFGSPRVGNGVFARALETAVPHERYVDCCDLVARVPPRIIGYEHAGRNSLRFIDAGGGIHVTPPDPFVDGERDRAAHAYRMAFALLHGQVPARELADHAPINYVSALMGLRRP